MGRENRKFLSSKKSYINVFRSERSNHETFLIVWSFPLIHSSHFYVRKMSDLWSDSIKCNRNNFLLLAMKFKWMNAMNMDQMKRILQKREVIILYKSRANIFLNLEHYNSLLFNELERRLSITANSDSII